MTNAELIKALRICSSQPCCDNCPRYDIDHAQETNDCCVHLLEDAADAIEAAEKRIAELMPKVGEWIDGDARKVTARCSVCGHLRLGNGAKWANMYVPFCEICGSRMKTVTDCHASGEGER